MRYHYSGTTRLPSLDLQVMVHTARYYTKINSSFKPQKELSDILQLNNDTINE